MSVFVPEHQMPCAIGVEPITAMPRRFKSGSVGWYASQKLLLDGVRCQISLSIVVIGTKPPANDEVVAIDKDGKEVRQTTLDDLPRVEEDTQPPKKPRKVKKA